MTNLKLIDRMSVLSVLPSEGRFTDLILVWDIKKKVAITQDEIKEFEIVHDEAGIHWNEKWNTNEFSIDLTDAESDLIKRYIIKLDSEEKLRSEMVGIHKIFVK